MRVEKVGIWSWVLQRVTGFGMAICLVIHFLVMHFGRFGPEGYNTFALASRRVSSPGWFIFYLLLLACASYHGLNGLWAVILDFNPPSGFRKLIGWAVVVFGLGVFIFALAALINLHIAGRGLG